METETKQKAKKETGQVRSLNACVRGARVFSDFNDKEWNNKIEIFYYNKVSIAAAKIESNKERKFNLFGPERISIVKKKVKFEKDLTVLKATRFGDFLNRIPQSNRVNDINMSDVNERRAIPKISLLKPIAKAVVENPFLMQKPKLSFPIKEKSKNSENERYTIPVKRMKNNFKAVTDTEKIFKLLFKQPVQGILIENLLANYPNLHKKFFGKYVSDITEDIKDVT